MAKTAHRQFYDFKQPDSHSTKDANKQEINGKEKREELFNYVRENIIGNNTVFSSPFGPRKMVYCDYTASGRSLKFIEDYITEQVLPQYGSTHTTTTVSSLQTTLFRHEARDIIRNAVKASEHDRIIFTGSGATSAVHKLLHGLMIKSNLVVFVDFTAHHSSLLPWRESGATVIRIKETSSGEVDICHLEELLKKYEGSQMIGCFTAASNITGCLINDTAVTKLLHKYSALACWDYATAAPYVDTVMNPVLPDDPEGLAFKDAIFFSLHKFVGGVQTPGVLIAKKNLFRNETPSESGGGTVFFVSREGHRYLKDIEEREEGGTPPVVETIRGGMVMQLKMSLTPSAIMERCQKLSERISEFIVSTPELVVLGNTSLRPRLPILSFLVKHEASGKFLHYNFVSAVLNDVFGIQSRGGCACAGPFAQDLLGIDENLANRYEAILMENPSLDRSHLRRKEEHGFLEVLRPGFVRINIPYTATEEQVSFILSAIQKVCRHGWKLLPQYIFNPETGEWKHHTNLVFRNRQWLQSISYEGGSFSANLKAAPQESPSLHQVLIESESIFSEAVKISQRMRLADESLLLTDEAKSLSWFLYPSEARNYMSSKSVPGDQITSVPFSPPPYPLNTELINKRPVYVWSSEWTAPPTTKMNLELTQICNTSDVKSNSSCRIVSNICGLKKENININEKQYNLNEENVNVHEEQNNMNGEKINVNSKVLCANNSCFQQNISANNNSVRISVRCDSKPRWVPPTKHIFNLFVDAVHHFNMIRPLDKVLVCLSGGKDSLSLLHTLHQYQFYARAKGISFSLGAVTVDPRSSSYDPRPLIPYLANLDIPYFFEQQGILKQAMEVDDLNSICSFCSRMKRGRIYAAARREGFNVLALGQHLDDLAESFLMSVFHNGRLRTMKASYTVREGDLRVIRPFVYVREKDLRQFAETNRLPIIPENCPGCFESPKERHRMKQLLAQQEILFPRLFWSLKTALLPLLSIRKTGIENALFGKRLLFDISDEDDDKGCEKENRNNPDGAKPAV